MKSSQADDHRLLWSNRRSGPGGHRGVTVPLDNGPQRTFLTVIDMHSSLYQQVNLSKSARVVSTCPPKPRQTLKSSLPPISTEPNGKERTRLKGLGARTPRVSHGNTETTLCLMVSKYRRVDQICDKTSVPDSKSNCRLTGETADGRSVETGHRIRGAVSHGSKLMTAKVQHDTNHHRGQQRVPCSSDSAIETEYESSDGRGRREKSNSPDDEDDDDDDDDEEFYTDQRIEEWVNKVNCCLFTTETRQRGGWTSAGEQDVATIKMVYSGL
ncbi:uncharacterized protein LOC112487569 [Cynoglossus semilaevis]|uniref:uncharacterized protein LOC112487569 n=1 Tax=Cynoglossus semilaevis TaxID=244447 RepID=UPI0004985E93|nr:uncharacterized protein LOC112487569 [Cynoglossus semilaevis]